MNQKIEAEIAIRNEIIAGLERENKLQAKLIQSQNGMIATLEEQITELRELLDEILRG